MFDIFVYLFETYYCAEACPEPDRLARKLSAAGFEEDDISDALEWLSGLQQLSAQELWPASATSSRIFDDDEATRLGTDCQGFLLTLEQTSTCTPALREMIIERAMALPELRITLPRFKVICLMVLWSQDQELNGLILEELLASEHDELLAH